MARSRLQRAKTQQPRAPLGGPRRWLGSIPVQYLYTAGVAGERFFQTLRERGRLAVTRCKACQVTYLPPRIYCEQCFADLAASWSEVAPTGRVQTYTVVHVDREGRRLRTPEIVAFVRIDGSDGGLVSRLLKVTPADLILDMPVTAVLAPQSRRRGTMTDILGFAPVSQQP